LSHNPSIRMWVVVIAFLIIILGSQGENISAAGASEVASSCAANQFANSESAAGVLACSLVNWANSITAFPSACAANGFVSQVAATLTCTASSLVQGANTISSYSKTLLNSTSVGWDFRTSTNTILAKLISQSCPANQFVNTVADSITCAALVNSIIKGTHTLQGAITFANSTSIGIKNAGQTLLWKILNVGWGNLTGFPAACPANQFVRQVGNPNTCSGNGVANVVRLDSDINLNTTAPTLTQNTFATFTSGTSGTKAFASNLRAKNTVIVCEGQSGVNTLPTTPTDTLSLTYVSIASATATLDAAVGCWDVMSGGGGADTVTGHYGATCTATNICDLFIQEVSGSDVINILSTTGSATVATLSPTMTSVSFTNTPLLLGFYVKATSGTDTAGASFTLLNGETGSLKYLTEKSTSLTSTSTTFPATFGTSSAFAGVGLVIQSASNAFSVALSANTNYVFTTDIDIGNTNAVATPIFWLHQMDIGVTLQAWCLFGLTGSASLMSECPNATDKTTINAISNSQLLIPFKFWGTIKVGSTATTLLVQFGSTTSGITNTIASKAGSFIMVTPTA
jgi:hypothetical protein